MYLSNVSGFSGEGDLLSKYGVEIRDTATFIVARRRWDEIVARNGDVQLTERPAEGDVLYFPLTKSFFEIRRVEHKDPFFQVGKLNVFKLECELMQFSSERVNTNIEEIDDIAQNKSHDIYTHQLLDETGNTLLLEYFTESRIILEDYKTTEIDSGAQNEYFTDNLGILDFSERNPFGDIL
jgi:hypothetical protein